MKRYWPNLRDYLLLTIGALLGMALPAATVTTAAPTTTAPEHGKGHKK